MEVSTGYVDSPGARGQGNAAGEELVVMDGGAAPTLGFFFDGERLHLTPHPHGPVRGERSAVVEAGGHLRNVAHVQNGQSHIYKIPYNPPAQDTYVP